MDVIDLAQKIYKTINERDARLKDRLVDGSIQTLDDYRYLVGEIRGMAYVEEELREIMKGSGCEDDDDD